MRWKQINASPSLITFSSSIIKYVRPAPNNDAINTFISMLPNGLPDSKVIEDIVLYHIALGRYPSTALTSGDIEMLNGDSVSVVVSDNAGGVTVNGENVIGPDNYVLDGVVHIIDAVLIPPSIDLGTTTASSGTKEEV